MFTVAQVVRLYPEKMLGKSVISLNEAERNLSDHFTYEPLWKNSPTESDKLLKTIIKEINRLTTDKEALVIKLRWFGEQMIKDMNEYGYSRGKNKCGVFRCLLKWTEVARLTGYTRQWAKRLEHKALDKLIGSEKLRKYIATYLYFPKSS